MEGSAAAQPAVADDEDSGAGGIGSAEAALDAARVSALQALAQQLLDDKALKVGRPRGLRLRA